MTVNERLFACGLIDRWNAAVRARNREEMISLLGEAAFATEHAVSTTDTVLANPVKYGF